jgi:hypothetical protein
MLWMISSLLLKGLTILRPLLVNNRPLYFVNMREMKFSSTLLSNNAITLVHLSANLRWSSISILIAPYLPGVYYFVAVLFWFFPGGLQVVEATLARLALLESLGSLGHLYA